MKYPPDPDDVDARARVDVTASFGSEVGPEVTVSIPPPPAGRAVLIAFGSDVAVSISVGLDERRDTPEVDMALGCVPADPTV